MYQPHERGIQFKLTNPRGRMGEIAFPLTNPQHLELQEIEKRLLWRGDVPPGVEAKPRPDWAGSGCNSLQMGIGWWKFQRGFIGEIHCRLEDWVGQECECGGGGYFVWGIDRHIPCCKCSGLGRIDAHGIAIVKQQPVTRIVFTDLYLGQDIPHFLQGYRVNDEGWIAGAGNVEAAALNWARKKAGLPSLRMETEDESNDRVSGVEVRGPSI